MNSLEQKCVRWHRMTKWRKLHVQRESNLEKHDLHGVEYRECMDCDHYEER